MTVQGYTLAFKPKTERTPPKLSQQSMTGLMSTLEQFAISARMFMPDGVRDIDKAGFSCMDHGSSLRQLAASLKNVTDRMPYRVICAPSEELKSRQDDILRELSRIPAHRNAHGFVRGRCALSCAQAHVNYWGKRDKGLVLLNADVEGFFHSTSREQVKNALVKHGIAETNTDLILDQCMLRASPELCIEALTRLARLFGISKPATAQFVSSIKDVILWENPIIDQYRHLILTAVLGLGPSIVPNGYFLPQGAPTSPVLSNLVCKIIDIRLTAMAKAFGAFYTRYADDITFSWPTFTKGKEIDGLKRCSAEVFLEYGYKYHPKKVRVVGPGGKQDIVGYVINSGRPTVSQSYRRRIREEIDRERKTKGATSSEVIDRLIGQAGYIQPLHPKEALWLKTEIGKLQFKTNRKVKTIDHASEPFEPSAATSRRKVTATA
jgi:Reverse transcriptase (RNA-dependent DNA polymerase)